MRRLFLFLCTLGISLLFVSSPIGAQAQFSGTELYDQLDSTASVIDPSNDTRDLGTMIGRVIQVTLSTLGVILLVLIVYAAFLWMTAAGNATQVAKAKSILTNAIIGMILVLAAYGIVTFVVNAFEQPDELATRAELLNTTQGASDLSDASLGVIIGTIISSFLAILGVIFLLLTLYAGFLWMTAAGNADNVAKAKRLLGQAIIGLVIILASYSITRFVINQLDDAKLVEDGNDVEINLFSN